MYRKKHKILLNFDPGMFVLIILFLFLLGFTIYFIWKPIIQNTSIYKQIYNQTYKFYQDNRWITFTSKRAKFSLKHPISWPITPASDKQLDENNYFAIDGFQDVENIDFQEEWVRNAGGPRLGFISVTKEKNINTLDDYIKTINIELPLYSKGTTVMIPPPKIEYLTIGGIEAISVSDVSGFGNLSPSVYDYRLVFNGFVYRFSTTASSRYLENKDKNNEIFQKMMSTVTFFK